MAGVYLSYPFCAQKCTYCNFASGVFPPGTEKTYEQRLLRDLAATDWPWTPETVYWGGGTPSMIDTDLLAELHRAIPGRPWREATLEAAPGSITRERAAAWREAGIDRVSLGVQSFVPREAARAGRKHTPELVAEEVAILRGSGIAKISIDLIAGLAGQTAESWRTSLDWLLRIAPDHASVYMLEVDEDSRLGRELLLGGVRYGAGDVPSPDRMADFYEEAVDRLAEAGLKRYEISNFARPGQESLHNLKYWRREPYLGFGADAHSFDGEWRWSTSDDVLAYATGAAEPERSRANAAEERLFLGLRLMEGIAAAEVAPMAAEERGLLERRDGRLRLTPRGVLLSNEVFEECIA